MYWRPFFDFWFWSFISSLFFPWPFCLEFYLLYWPFQRTRLFSLICLKFYVLKFIELCFNIFYFLCFACIGFTLLFFSCHMKSVKLRSFDLRPWFFSNKTFSPINSTLILAASQILGGCIFTFSHFKVFSNYSANSSDQEQFRSRLFNCKIFEDFLGAFQYRFIVYHVTIEHN